MERLQRVAISPEAAELIEKLKGNYGNLIFHQSGGCCDGSAPMCFQGGEMYIDDNDVLLGYVAGCPFYMSRDQFEYWKHTHLTLDVVKGRGASFSLEIPLGVRFVIKSRLLTPDENL
ncbi:DUF779 domain-containing protein [Emticicia sp. TH156]|uniref:DUF779 domain-containing protein n=1 Tax=Emticicia sp. TH156 TaxID=2067454 RepID=UPI000C793475|nr:DUF779 domain-containing protein [Emticicia sp. TH156]PLK43278.1 DUF779 domain-containing protein [Emticicia sp. TH156]